MTKKIKVFWYNSEGTLCSELVWLLNGVPNNHPTEYDPCVTYSHWEEVKENN